jgi:hypothetical protein
MKTLGKAVVFDLPLLLNLIERRRRREGTT